MLTQDPNAEHEIRIRWLGNAEVFVTCKCMDLVRRGWRGKSRWGKLPRRENVQGSADWKSFGDFPVGTPSEKLIEAYQRHLEGIDGRPEPALQARTEEVAS